MRLLNLLRSVISREISEISTRLKCLYSERLAAFGQRPRPYEDRIADPTLLAGDGYLNFDIAFNVPEADLEEIRRRLETIVAAKWQQLRNGTPTEQGLPGVAGTTEPSKVEFGTPTWTGGRVSLDAPQAKELIRDRMSEAEPSLLFGNVAVFSTDLTPQGPLSCSERWCSPLAAESI
jgi:hypothetical protein